jgi:hypothetical protein
MLKEWYTARFVATASCLSLDAASAEKAIAVTLPTTEWPNDSHVATVASSAQSFR